MVYNSCVLAHRGNTMIDQTNIKVMVRLEQLKADLNQATSKADKKAIGVEVAALKKILSNEEVASLERARRAIRDCYVWIHLHCGKDLFQQVIDEGTYALDK